MGLALCSDGLWHEPAPTECPAGHRAQAGGGIVGWNSRKRVYHGLRCDETNAR